MRSQFCIPESWTGDTLKPGHAIGVPENLFSKIPVAKVEEWREAFGGEELRKQKALEAEKAAAGKAAREGGERRSDWREPVKSLLWLE